MSLYQKFIESASPSKQPGLGQPLKMLPRSPMLASSTPISKQQYRRLVEAAELSQPQYAKSASKRPHRQSGCATDQLDSYFKTDDPVLLKWLRAMRFETELECMTTLQARTLATDEYSAGALSVRNSQVSIQRMRSDSNFILDYIDYLIERLPLKYNSLAKFHIEFSELWTRLINQTGPHQQQQQQQQQIIQHTNQTCNNLTIINCTPRKQHNQLTASQLKPLDQLAGQMRSICMDYANLLNEYQENSTLPIENGLLESSLRKLKELYGRYIEISIRTELANIVRALQYDFSQASLNRLSSSSSLLPTRPFESSSAQLPLKWTLIALWQLTKDDSYLCRTLTKNWQLSEQPKPKAASPVASRVAKRLDYSTKYEPPTDGSATSSDSENYHPLRSDYQKLYQICNLQQQRQLSSTNRRHLFNQPQQQMAAAQTAGALSSALKNKQQPPVRQVSTIELLIDIIISQPNKHERLDMMNFIHSQVQHDKLIDLDEWDQSVSAAIYTSNQYKVAALRILNHLCVNEQAVKTILKCFSTPPPSPGQPIPENKIIRSIFECYQTSQEHIYQNETMFHTIKQANACKRPRQQVSQLDDEEHSDYGSRQTNSQQTGSSLGGASDDAHAFDEGDDVVVKEAIRLLVQLTIPFHRSNQGLDYYNLIGRFSIESLVKYLTNIIKSTSSREMLFLSLTALANISFITTEPIKIYGTNRVMLEMFRASKSRSKDLEIRDQAVTILANTADKNLLDIVSNGGLTFLLSCLESCPTRMANYKQLTDRLNSDSMANDDINGLNIENKPRDRKPIDFRDNFPDLLECACDQQQAPNPSTLRAPSLCISRLSTEELAAMERIHQKTAVAFARMSADPSTTRMVLKYGGIKQMIDLCKLSHKRNHSDTVLIACIAALRKMAKVIESETFRYYNALDLIELELNQALEIYGSNQDHQQSSDRPWRLFASDV